MADSWRNIHSAEEAYPAFWLYRRPHRPGGRAGTRQPPNDGGSGVGCRAPPDDTEVARREDHVAVVVHQFGPEVDIGAVVVAGLPPVGDGDSSRQGVSRPDGDRPPEVVHTAPAHGCDVVEHVLDLHVRTDRDRVPTAGHDPVEDRVFVLDIVEMERLWVVLPGERDDLLSSHRVGGERELVIYRQSSKYSVDSGGRFSSVLIPTRSISRADLTVSGTLGRGRSRQPPALLTTAGAGRWESPGKQLCVRY
jgi:hypothetical protein